MTQVLAAITSQCAQVIHHSSLERIMTGGSNSSVMIGLIGKLKMIMELIRLIRLYLMILFRIPGNKLARPMLTAEIVKV